MNNELIQYFNGDELAANVWLSKYAQNGETHPDQMHGRMAKEFARIEKKYIEDENALGEENKQYEAERFLSKYGKVRSDLTEESIYELFKDFKYIVPQGSIMSTLGTDLIASLSNCLAGNIKVLTRQGFKEIKSLVNTEQEILTKGGEWVIAPFKSYGLQETVKLTLTRGKSDTKIIECTKDHNWFLKSNNRNPKKIKTLDLKIGDKLHNQFGKGWGNLTVSPFGIAHGLVFGDGYSPKNENYYASITLCAESRQFSKYFPECYISTDENLCEGGSDYYGKLPNYFKNAPDLSENKSYLLGWLAGYFAADGNIHKNSLRLSSVKLENLKLVQDVCGILGIHCGEIKKQNRISNLTNKPSIIYTVHFSSYFLKESFFIKDSHKQNYKPSDNLPNSWTVANIEESIKQEVFCAEVPNTHSFTIEGNILSGNCWVAESPLDSYAGIHKTDGDLIYYYKRRGGVGIDISNLRPSNTLTNNTAKSSTGAVSFMNRFSNTTREVAMNGRRGALMISMDVNHPDIMDFIKIKRDLTQVTGANISIKLNNEFMKAVENNGDYILRFPCDSSEFIFAPDNLNYNELYKGTDNTYIKKIRAKEYWDEIIKSAKEYAEPGLMYWDNMLNNDPAAVYEQYRPICSNPCGEQFLNANDSCRLMAVNLFSFVLNPFTEEAKLDFSNIYKVFYEALRLGDNLVDLEAEYIDRIIEKIKSDPESNEIKQQELNLWIKSKEKCLAGRRVGLGITALGDMLAALNLKYDSDEGLKVIEAVMHTKMEAELDCTIDLAILRGHFDGWDTNLEFEHWQAGGDYHTPQNEFYKMLLDEFPKQCSRMWEYGRRNINWSTVAPTGSVSILTQTSSGVEPLFMPYYMRRKKINPNEVGVRVDFTDQNGDKWQEFAVLHPKFKDWINTVYDKGLFEHISKEELQGYFEKSPWYKATANDIDWKKRVEIQAILQKYTTNAISSTINLPSTVTYEEVSNIYMYGWKAGLKGQTVYVDGSRSGVLVSTDTKPQNNSFEYKDALKRPKELDGEMFITVANGQKYKVIVGSIDGKPYEVFASLYVEEDGKPRKGKIIKEKKNLYNFYSSGEILYVTADMTDEEAIITRLASMSLRHGANIKFIVEQLNKSNGNITSFGKAVARILKKYIPEGESSTLKCEDCGSTNVVFEEGCSKCKSCGKSACG
jgi:ribonucleoside-diphosphate reductase alpha chain